MIGDRAHERRERGRDDERGAPTDADVKFET
jgi:hypothetical protein